MTTTLHTGQVEHLVVDNVPVKVEITNLTPWNATFTVTGAGVRNPERPRNMPVAALACWLELAKKGGKAR